MATNMIRTVVTRFTEEFGPPTRTTKKVAAWEMRPDMGIVVEIDKPEAGNYARVWTPDPGDRLAKPLEAVYYGAGLGRHSNTYATPGLQRSMPALRFRIDDLSQMLELVRFIREMPPIRMHAV